MPTMKIISTLNIISWKKIQEKNGKNKNKNLGLPKKISFNLSMF